MDRLAYPALVLLIAHLALGASSASPATPQNRLPRIFDENRTAILRANMHPAVASHATTGQGSPSGSERMPRMSLHFSLTAAQQADLDQLLTAQQNRRSPQFHKFLTPEQFADRFGLSPADIDTVTRWLQNRGFSNIQPARARTSITFSGSVAQAQSAFHAHIRRYSLNGDTFLANTADPELPEALAAITQSIGGLNNFRATPLSQRAHPHLTTSTCYPACNAVVPDDWQTIYNVKPLYTEGLDGTGVSIAVVGESDVPVSDLRAFRSAANLPAKDPSTVVPVGNVDPGILTGKGQEFEAYIDLEWAGAIAKNASIIYVVASGTVGNGVSDAIMYAIDQNLAPILSISYGYCEDTAYASFFNTFNSLLAQANAQGMTIVVASGDNGPACNLGSATQVTQGYSASFPASSPYVTAIGGTEFQYNTFNDWSAFNNANGGSALSYIPERVWNDGPGQASGGGASIFFSAPSWQIAPGIPNDGWRDFPDISFTASLNVNPTVVCASGSCVSGFLTTNGYYDAAGGTSVGAPTFASALALLVQKTGAPLGNINPNLYSLAQISSNIFNDTIYGSNNQNCLFGSPDCLTSSLIGFSALPGFDQATGWGSVNIYNFVEQWSGDIQLSVNPTSLTLNPGTSIGSTITVTPQNHFSGKVTLTCSVSSSLIDVTCSIPSTPINTSGTAVVTLTATKDAHHFPWRHRLPRIPPPYLLALGLLLGAAVLFRKRPIDLYASLAASTIGVLFMVSCGGGAAGGSKTPVNPLLLSCSIPSAVPQSVAFNGNCTASGGTSPYTYSMGSGYLPAGLNLNTATGGISGTPYSPGLTSFSIVAIDSGSPQQQTSKSFSNFTVNATGPLVLTCQQLSSMTVGASVYSTCTVGGQTPPTQFALSAGALPSGITMNSQAEGYLTISGIPTKTGNASFSLKATDSSQPAQSQSQAFAFTINPPAKLVNNLFPILTGQTNVSFSIPLSASGGLPPYTYSITGGALPPGITLNPTGTISGTPQTKGSSQFSLTVTDSYTPQQTATVAATFEVAPPPPESGTVTITATSGGIVNTTTIAVSVPAGQ